MGYDLDLVFLAENSRYTYILDKQVAYFEGYFIVLEKQIASFIRQYLGNPISDYDDLIVFRKGNVLFYFFSLLKYFFFKKKQLQSWFLLFVFYV